VKIDLATRLIRAVALAKRIDNVSTFIAKAPLRQFLPIFQALPC